MDHTATLFVVNGRGQLQLRFAHDQAVDEMLSDVEYLLARRGEGAGAG